MTNAGVSHRVARNLRTSWSWARARLMFAEGFSDNTDCPSGSLINQCGRRESPMSTMESTGTRDVTYDLISVVYHALQGAETYQMYEQDAQQAGDQEAAALFHEAHQSSRQWADRAKALLGQRMNQGGSGR